MITLKENEMKKKIFSISTYDPNHPSNENLIKEGIVLLIKTWNEILPKSNLTEDDIAYTKLMGRNEQLTYHHLFYGDDLIGYFGYINTGLEIKIGEFYLQEKFCTSKYMTEIINFVKTIAKESNLFSITMEVFYLQKLVTKLKLLKLKSATVMMYTEVD